MLTEKRYEVILNLLNEKNSVTVTEIKELLGISESTIRRDLAALDKAGKLIKVFGGAVAADGGFTTAEPSVAQMIDFIKEKSATFVTNAVSHAQRLAAQGYRVYLIGGELKGTTEAVVGNQAILSLQKLHFSKAFLGTNGVGLKAGFSTPDYSEALVKQTAVEQARQVFVLADYSKFGNVSSVTFASLERGVILTDRRPPESFGAVRNIKVVGEWNGRTLAPHIEKQTPAGNAQLS